MTYKPITNEERYRALALAYPSMQPDEVARHLRLIATSYPIERYLLDVLCHRECKIAGLEHRIANAEQAAHDEHESANKAHGLLADLCDILFGDEDRAATHGYEGVRERAREVVARSAELEPGKHSFVGEMGRGRR